MNWLNEVGTFRARVSQTQPPDFASSKNGKPYIAVLIETDRGQINWSGWLTTEGAIKQTVKGLRAMGWQGTNLDDLSTVGSKEFEIVTHLETYEGKDYCRIQWVNDLDATPAASTTGRMDQSARKKLAAQLRGTIAALGPAPAPKPAARPAPAQSAPTGTEDDIPF